MYSHREEIAKAIQYQGSHQALADAIDVSRQLVGQWWRNEKLISLRRAAEINLACGGELDILKLAPHEKKLFYLMQRTFSLPTYALTLVPVYFCQNCQKVMTLLPTL